MLPAILSRKKIPFRTSSRRAYADGMQSQSSPILFLSHGHVGFLWQVEELFMEHGLQQAPNLFHRYPASTSRQQRELLSRGLHQHNAISAHCNEPRINAVQNLGGAERGIVADDGSQIGFTLGRRSIHNLERQYSCKQCRQVHAVSILAHSKTVGAVSRMTVEISDCAH